MGCKYPNVKVELGSCGIEGRDGNAFAILGAVQKAMRRNGLSKQQIEEYLNDAMLGSYNNVVLVTQQYVKVE